MHKIHWLSNEVKIIKLEFGYPFYDMSDSFTFSRPSITEQNQRNDIMRRVLEFIRTDQTIKLPPFDASLSRPDDQFALLSIGLEQNPFGGEVGCYRYQFEGEEDLLHLIILKTDRTALSVVEAQSVASFLLEGVPPALIWLRPGEFSQHFYVGHDELIDKLVVV